MNFRSKISIFFLLSSIVLLCYTAYRSEIYHSGVKFQYYLKYYLLSFSFIIFSLITFFLKDKTKKNILLVAISFSVSLYLIEGFTTYVTLYQEKFKIYKKNTGLDYEKRSKIQYFFYKKKENPNIVFSLSPYNFLNEKNINYLPLSGLPNRETIHCNENGYFSVYQSDRYGFNNPDKEWEKNIIELFLVGDSFVHGNCVNEPDTIAGNLRKLNKNLNGVLNLGQRGNGPLVEYAILREYLPVVKVKKVLWFYYEDDDLYFSKELEHPILMNYFKDKNFSQNLSLNQSYTQKILQEKLLTETIRQKKSSRRKTLTQFLLLTNVRSILFERYFNKQNTLEDLYGRKTINEFKKILKLSNELVQENNANLYFVYLPDQRRYIKNNNTNDYRHYKKVIEIANNLDIEVIDLKKELFDKHEDPLSLFSWRERNHYNELGYKLVSQKVLDKIKQ